MKFNFFLIFLPRYNSNKTKIYFVLVSIHVLLDFLLTVKAAPHECVIRTSQP